jgi:hypothetical protein
MGHSTTEEMSAVQRERGEKIVFDNSKCIRTSKGKGGLISNFLWMKIWMFSVMTQ